MSRGNAIIYFLLRWDYAVKGEEDVDANMLDSWDERNCVKKDVKLCITTTTIKSV